MRYTLLFLAFGSLLLCFVTSCIPPRIKPPETVDSQKAGAYCGIRSQASVSIRYRCAAGLVCENEVCSPDVDSSSPDVDSLSPDLDAANDSLGTDSTSQTPDVSTEDLAPQSDSTTDDTSDSDGDGIGDNFASTDFDPADGVQDQSDLDDGEGTADLDLAPPVVSIISAPSTTTANPSATFDFNCDQPPCTFECAKDLGPFVPCSAPYVLAVSHGSHTLSIRATTGDNRTGPATISNAWTFIGWKSVAAGARHVCAVSLDGERWCWGKSAGLGLNSSDPHPFPTRLEGETTVWRSVASGLDHSCGLDNGFQIWCWGPRLLCGIEKDFVAGIQTIPKLIDTTKGPSSFQRLVSAQSHTCGIGGDDTLWCWGNNDFVQLGVVDYIDFLPVQVEEPPSVYGWIGVATGYAHTCAIGKSDRSLYCWGANWNGQLGVGGQSPAKTPTKVPGTTKWLQVSAGSLHTCAVDVDHKLWCWGKNDVGQLGVQDWDPRDLPANVANSVLWASVSTSSEHTCAIDTMNQLWCWGKNDSGQLGFTDKQHRNKPELVPGTTAGWVAVVTGAGFSCAIRTDDSLWCWGDGTSGELGNGTSEMNAVPSLIRFADE